MDLENIKELRDEAIKEITHILEVLEFKTNLEILEAKYCNLSDKHEKGGEFEFNIMFKSI